MKCAHQYHKTYNHAQASQEAESSMLAQRLYHSFNAALTQQRDTQDAEHHAYYQQEDKGPKQNQRQSSGAARQGRVGYFSHNLGTRITLQLAPYQAHIAMNYSSRP
jgi:hypothetical protein